MAPRVALFQWEWPIDTHTVDMARMLAAGGREVDLYLYRCSREFIAPEVLAGEARIRVYDFSEGPAGRRLKGLGRAARAALGGGGTPAVVDEGVVRRSAARFAEARYDCAIGVEKKGLVWAGRLCEASATPVVYYSLELYVEDHPAFLGSAEFAALREEERRHARRAAGLIIQDPLRAEVLSGCNGMAGVPVAFLPVSLMGGRVAAGGKALHGRLGLPDGTRIVLNLGMMGKGRLSEEIVGAAGALAPGWALVFHGGGDSRLVETDVRRRGAGNVFVSSDLVGREELPGLVASASAGLALYRQTYANDRLTAFSSGKVALYCKCGVPLIAFRNESYEELLARARCGVLVDEVGEIAEAVARIERGRPAFEAEAHRAYEEVFRYEKNWSAVEVLLSSLHS